MAVLRAQKAGHGVGGIGAVARQMPSSIALKALHSALVLSFLPYRDVIEVAQLAGQVQLLARLVVVDHLHTNQLTLQLKQSKWQSRGNQWINFLLLPLTLFLTL